MPEQPDLSVWDGDPSSYENVTTSCKWFGCSLKESDRRLAAPRIWQKLEGAACQEGMVDFDHEPKPVAHPEQEA